MGAEFEVFDGDAPFVIALVAHNEALGNRAVGKLPGEAVGLTWAAVNADMAVALYESPLPFPATVLVRR